MKHVHYDEGENQDVEVPGAEKCRIRVLIGEADGAPTFCMRRFELEPGGRTPRHEHGWEHEVHILEGEGTVLGNGRENAFRAGDVIFVPSEEEHYFVADRGVAVAFLCLIPLEG